MKMPVIKKGIKKLAVLCALLILALEVSAGTSFAAIEPAVTAQSAIVYCENTGEEIYSHDPDKKLPPYSVTKLMTALVTVMNSPLDTKVKVSQAAASQRGSLAGLKQGEIVTVEQLLYGALVASGNDAAYALAEAVSGDVGTFVKHMNKTAKDIGCTSTNFVNPSGWKDQNHYSTCEDILLITKVALENETIAKIAGTKSYLMKPTNLSDRREFHSNVKNLTDDGCIYAGKNGYWSESEATTAFGYNKNGLHLYVVILGDTEIGRLNDAKALVKYAGEIIDGYPVIEKDQKLGAIRIKHGAKTKLDVFAETSGYAYIPAEASKDLIKTELDLDRDVTAPVSKGDHVGVCRIMVGEEEVNEVPLIIKEDVEEGWFTSYLGISNDVAVVLGAILAVLLLLALIIAVLRIKNKIKRKRARKRRVQEIARQELMKEEDHRDRGWDM